MRYADGTRRRSGAAVTGIVLGCISIGLFLVICIVYFGLLATHCLRSTGTSPQVSATARASPSPGDRLGFKAVLRRVRIRRRGPGRPRIRPGRVLADEAYSGKAYSGKAYSGKANRAYLRGRGIREVSRTRRRGPQPRQTRRRRWPSSGVRPGPVRPTATSSSERSTS
jgi:hypothetical protein